MDEIVPGAIIQDRENHRDIYEVLAGDEQTLEITPIRTATTIKIPRHLENRYRIIPRNALGDRLHAKTRAFHVYVCPACGQGYRLPKEMWSMGCGCRRMQCPYCGNTNYMKRHSLTNQDRPFIAECGTCKRVYRPEYIHDMTKCKGS